jgi:hypothetical protein
MGKPRVWKMGGHWVWRCGNHTEMPAGEEYIEDRWPHTWAICLAAAIRHQALYHPSGSEPAEEIEVP